MSAPRTPDELHSLILRSGRTVEPDAPEHGRLRVLPPPGEDLAVWIRLNKDALLAYARDLKRLREDEEAVSGNGASENPTVESFPFGQNNPTDPDGEASGLLASLRAVGHVVTIDAADRTKLRITNEMAHGHYAAVKRLNPALLALLEAEARDAELSAAPSPFRRPGVGGSRLDARVLRVEIDGVSGIPPMPVESGDPGAGEGVQAGEGGGGEAIGQSGENGQGGPEGPAGQPTDAVPAFAGWLRVPTKPPKKKNSWRKSCEGVTWKSTWTTLLEYAKESTESALEAVVMPAGREP